MAGNLSLPFFIL